MNEELRDSELTSAHMKLSNRMKDLFTGTSDHDKTITNHRAGRGVLADAKSLGAALSNGQYYDYAWWLDCAAQAHRDAFLYVFEEDSGVSKLRSEGIWKLKLVELFADWESALTDMKEFIG